MPEIRQLGEADGPAWLTLRLALWPHHTPAEFDTDITGLLAHSDLQPAFGAFDNGRLIGFAEAAERPWGDGCETAPVGWLEGIYVDPSHRHRGVGAALVEAVTTWARAQGYAELGSDTAIDNQLSLQSHSSWGFQETKRVVMLRKRLT